MVAAASRHGKRTQSRLRRGLPCAPSRCFGMSAPAGMSTLYQTANEVRGQVARRITPIFACLWLIQQQYTIACSSMQALRPPASCTHLDRGAPVIPMHAHLASLTDAC